MGKPQSATYIPCDDASANTLQSEDAEANESAKDAKANQDEDDEATEDTKTDSGLHSHP